MPEEHPLQALTPLQFILEPKLVLLVCELQEVQQLRGRLDDREWRRLRVVHQYRNAAVGIETEEPFLLLLIGIDVDEGRGPFRAVAVCEFFEEDLRSLAIGRVLGDEVQTFGFGDFLWSLGDVEIVRHGEDCPRESRMI